MDLKIAVHSDVGIKKTTNQDSVFVKTARTDYGMVALLAVCDGMGGLAKGELASATLVRELDRWFLFDFPALLYQKNSMEHWQENFKNFITMVNKKIALYGRTNHVDMGTTLAVLLIVGNRYDIVNVGDSRVYLLKEKALQITKDQTFVQREVDAGRMTVQQARIDSRRNMLLQCVGASQTVVPDFHSGTIQKGTDFLICSDGFRHVVSEDEIYSALYLQRNCTEKDMEEKLVYLTELNKKRQETDNISSILVQCN